MKAPSQHGVSGTRPAGATSDREAASRVRDMFGRIAPRYDLLNHLLSLDVDKVWRRRVTRKFSAILHDSQAKILDLCCGTGDLALAFRREAPRGAQITGADFVPEMLVRARQKANSAQAAVEFVEADALALPFADGSFHLLSCAFGFRNLANYDSGIREIYRVLRPGGYAAILEFSDPPGRVLGPLYRAYFRHVLPHLGGAISGCGAAYAYLPESVGNFPSPEELRGRFDGAGFSEVQFERWTGGIVTLHTARK